MNDELIHYGVLGMKWGKRKARYDQGDSKGSKKSNTINKKYNDSYQYFDRKTFGNRGVSRINKRMNEGMSYDEAYEKEVKRAFNTRRAVTVGLPIASAIVKKATPTIKKYAEQYATNKARQRANDCLAKIGTIQYEKVAGDVYQRVMR